MSGTITSWRRSWLAGTLFLLGGLMACDAGAVQAIGFSAGGSECKPGDAASSFAAGSVVHMVANYAPALPVGDQITITVFRDGSPQADLGATAEVKEEAQDCVYMLLRALEAGHYRLEIALDPNPTGMPPLSGDFDVTP